MEDAYELLVPPPAEAEDAAAAPPTPRVLLTCEHASARIPEGAWPAGWPDADRWIVGMHWSIDLGAEALTRELAAALPCPAILARFSRLLCDCNRPLTSETLFRRVADSRPIALNETITEEERKWRLTLLYDPYHAAIDGHLRRHRADLVFSIHSFTDEYEGQRRAVEIGVLFKDDDALAKAMQQGLQKFGYDCRLNEPWSGQEGFMYSADWHAKDHGAQALMIEVRQDLLTQKAWRQTFVPQLVSVLRSLASR